MSFEFRTLVPAIRCNDLRFVRRYLELIKNGSLSKDDSYEYYIKSILTKDMFQLFIQYNFIEFNVYFINILFTNLKIDDVWDDLIRGGFRYTEKDITSLIGLAFARCYGCNDVLSLNNLKFLNQLFMREFDKQVSILDLFDFKKIKNIDDC